MTFLCPQTHTHTRNSDQASEIDFQMKFSCMCEQKYLANVTCVSVTQCKCLRPFYSLDWRASQYLMMQMTVVQSTCVSGSDICSCLYHHKGQVKWCSCLHYSHVIDDTIFKSLIMIMAWVCIIVSWAPKGPYHRNIRI